MHHIIIEGELAIIGILRPAQREIHKVPSAVIAKAVVKSQRLGVSREWASVISNGLLELNGSRARGR